MRIDRRSEQGNKDHGSQLFEEANGLAAFRSVIRDLRSVNRS